MKDMFLFFFTPDCLQKICYFTNTKASEVVWKYRVRRADDKLQTKVWDYALMMYDVLMIDDTHG